MPKKKEIAKVPDKTLEKEPDPLSLDCSGPRGSPVANVALTKALLDSVGVCEGRSAMFVLSDVLNVLCEGKGDLDKWQEKANQILSMMTELDPQDGFEGMLVTQMLATHGKAMECFKMAIDKKSDAVIYFGLQNQSIKLMRLYTQQLEALDKHRRKGNQKMIVEHVHVHEGGQAIVGNVNQDGGG